MPNSRPSRDTLNIRICLIIAERATCKRASVGCVITKNHRIVSSGYNGALGVHDCSKECHLDEKCKHAVHAEANAILAAAKEGISLDGATLYCTHQPCVECSRLIIQAGIKRVVYFESYHSPAQELFETYNVECVQYNPNDHEDKNNKKQERSKRIDPIL